MLRVIGTLGGAFGLALTGLIGCTSGDDAVASGSDGGVADGGVVSALGEVYAVTDFHIARIDVGAGEERASFMHDLSATALHVAQDAVLLGGELGELLILDPDSLQERAKLSLGSQVDQIASKGSEAYVAVFGDASAGLAPEILRVDLATNAVSGHMAVIEVNENHDGLLVEGDELIVLTGNSFALLRVSLASESVVLRAELGQDPNDPQGPRGDFYGYGSLAAAGSSLFVLDEYSKFLLGVDRTSFEVASSLDLQQPLESGGRSDLASNGAELFLSLADLDQVLVFDGGTGKLDRTLETADGARAVAVEGDRVYLDADESIGDMVVLDAQSGAELARVPGVFADRIAVR